MKSAVTFLSLAVATLLISEANAQVEYRQAKLVELLQVSLDYSSEDLPQVTFTVAKGGPCHTYQAYIMRVKNQPVLEVWDYELKNCTQSEYSPYTTTVSVRDEGGKGQIRLANPLHINVHSR